MSTDLTLTPIGVVKSQFETNTPAEEMRRYQSQLIIEPEFLPGLLGLEAEAEILITFLFHRIQAAEIQLQLHPRHNPENPLRGVFATRTQFRPNRLGTTVARIEQIDGDTITVSGLDAQDGAPLIDIKPYAPYFDAGRQRHLVEIEEVASLDDARDAIDVLDREIIRLFGNRAKYVHQVVNFKKRPEDVQAPTRYAEVMRTRRTMAEAAGLNPDVIEEMYKLLVNNFIKEEIELINQREQGNRVAE